MTCIHTHISVLVIAKEVWRIPRFTRPESYFFSQCFSGFVPLLMRAAVEVVWLEGETYWAKAHDCRKVLTRKDWQRKDSQAETASLRTRLRNDKHPWSIAWYTETWHVLRYHWQAQKTSHCNSNLLSERVKNCLEK